MEKLVRISPFFFLLFEITSDEFLLINFQHLIFRTYLSFIFLHKNCANFFPFYKNPFTQDFFRKILLTLHHRAIFIFVTLPLASCNLAIFPTSKQFLTNSTMLKKRKERIEFAKFFTNYKW